MRKNIGLSRGLIMTENLMIELSKKTGRKESAHALISRLATRAVKEDTPFDKVLLDNEQLSEHLSTQQIKDALYPDKYVGLAEDMVEKVLKSCGRGREQKT